jgi:hypothetical protein
LIWISRFAEIWTRSSDMHLEGILTHESSLEFQTCEFLDLLREFHLNFDFGYLELHYSMDLVLHYGPNVGDYVSHNTRCYSPPLLKKSSPEIYEGRRSTRKWWRASRCRQKEWNIETIEMRKVFSVSPIASFDDRSISPCGMWRFFMVLLVWIFTPRSSWSNDLIECPKKMIIFRFQCRAVIVLSQSKGLQ